MKKLVTAGAGNFHSLLITIYLVHIFLFFEYKHSTKFSTISHNFVKILQNWLKLGEQFYLHFSKRCDLRK